MLHARGRPFIRNHAPTVDLNNPSGFHVAKEPERAAISIVGPAIGRQSCVSLRFILSLKFLVTHFSIQVSLFQCYVKRYLKL